MENLENLTAKELKVIAKERGLKFNIMSSQKEMLELLNTSKASEDATENDEDIDEETPEDEIIEEVKEKTPGTYVVITPIKKDGKRYEKGDKITFDEITPEVEYLISEKIIG